MGNSTAFTIACVMCCFMVFVLPIPLTSIIIGAENRDDSCQSMDSIGLELHEWLIGAGIAGILSSILILAFSAQLYLGVAGDSTGCTVGAGVGFVVLVILSSLFNIIYSIIGAVILYRSNIQCLNEGTSLGVMSQITLCFYWLAILGNCCTSRRYANSDN